MWVPLYPHRTSVVVAGKESMTVVVAKLAPPCTASFTGSDPEGYCVAQTTESPSSLIRIATLSSDQLDHSLLLGPTSVLVPVVMSCTKKFQRVSVSPGTIPAPAGH